MTKIVFEALDEDDLGMFDIVCSRYWEDTPTMGTTIRALDYEIATLDRYRVKTIPEITIRNTAMLKAINNKPQVIDLDEDDDECI